MANQPDGEVHVYEEIGVTIPLDEDGTAHLRYRFGHSQVSPSSGKKDIEATTKKVQAFNDKQLSKRTGELTKWIRKFQKAGR